MPQALRGVHGERSFANKVRRSSRNVRHLYCSSAGTLPNESRRSHWTRHVGGIATKYSIGSATLLAGNSVGKFLLAFFRVLRGNFKTSRLTLSQLYLRLRRLESTAVKQRKRWIPSQTS